MAPPIDLEHEALQLTRRADKTHPIRQRNNNMSSTALDSSERGSQQRRPSELRSSFYGFPFSTASTGSATHAANSGNPLKRQGALSGRPSTAIAANG